MRRLLQIVLLLAFVFSVHPMTGQIVISGGMNAASVRSTNGFSSVETSSRIGYHIGISKKSALNETFLFNPGIFYSSKGGGFGAFTYDLEINYIDAAFHFVYQKFPDYGFFAEAGPYVGYLLSAKSGPNDEKNNYNNLDLGLSIGAGYDFGRLIMGGRGQIGLTNITDQDSGIAQDIRTTNINGQLYIGFKL